MKVLGRKPIAEVDDQTVIQADMAEKALPQVETTVRKLLGARMETEKAAKLAETLSCGTWTHDYPISVYGVPAHV